jgi:hypothetical protein
MTSPLLRRAAPLACLVAAIAAGSSCGSSAPTETTGTSTTAEGGAGPGGGGAGGFATASLSLPQLVRGAARVDTDAFPTIPLVVAVSGAMPEAVEVSVDGATIAAEKEADRFVATIDAAALSEGAHALVARAVGGAADGATATGTLVTGTGSLRFTDFASDGPAYDGHLALDAARDALAFTWISAPGPKHTFSMARLDGAFARSDGQDITLNDPNDEPLSGYTAFGKDAIGVVYRTPKTGDVHWLVKMRVLDPDGKELVPAMDLTADGAAFSMAQAGADPGGFSAAWLHITKAVDPAHPPPVEVRFARWDLASKKLVGPITLDADQPPPSGSADGSQILQPLAEIGLSCNQKVCLVAYSRDLYDKLVLLNVPKIFVAVVDLATGALAGPPEAVAPKDWDTQMFGQHLVTLADGSFALVYTANDTSAAIVPKSPCDETLERDVLRVARFDETGKQVGKPTALFDHEGTRQYPRIAEHPAGFAVLWEDQRSLCGTNGRIRMASSVVGKDLSGLSDPYLEWPGSIGLPPEDPTLAVTGTSFVVGWSDNRHGNGLLDPKPEIFLDTYWRR